MAHTLFVPLMLTLGAGLATGIGSTIALFAHRTNKRLLSFSLGLSGGVMIYVSFVELFQQAREAIGAIYGPQTGMGITTLAFFGGVLLIGVIDRLVPSVENPHEAHMIEELEKKPKNAKLMRMGLSASTTSRKASPPSPPPSKIPRWVSPSPSPLPYTTYPKVSRFRSPSFTPPATG